MSRPEDIPEDVWEASRERVAAIRVFTGEAAMTEIVARAILAAKLEEREACALVADEYVWDEHALAQATDIGRAVHHQSVEISNAIRSRS